MNDRLKGLYDMANSKDGTLSKFEEQKLRKEVMNNKRLFAQNKNLFAEDESKYFTCSLYEPCRICSKCLNKASHLYVRCQTCQIPICTHKHKDRITMIKRKNFEIKVSEKTLKELKRLSLEMERTID